MVAEAKRGYIYKFSKDNSERYVVVVSNNRRATDRIVSVVMFGDSSLGHDVVRVNHRAIGGVKYLHCGMLTYTKREYLTEEVGALSVEDMEKVDDTLCHELSIREDVVAERNFYKSAFEELLKKVGIVNTGE